jgi:dienelactone hydrolase
MICFVLLSLPLLPLPSLGAEPYLIDDSVPLPADAAPVRDGPWSGVWVGAWDGRLKHILVVERAAADGTASVIYAYGDVPFMGIRRGWVRLPATTGAQTLRIDSASFSAAYKLSGADQAGATYTRSKVTSHATMTRVTLASLTQPASPVPWTRGRSEMVTTRLSEAGQPVRLEVVTFRPPGPGPFPLAVVNHGSTGRGTDPALFAETWFDVPLADALNARGWIAAFPQRRGRGKSDGLYDEGFGPDRMAGYTCEPERSLAGAERALTDIEAAIAAIRQWPDVASGPLLLAGVSRGGALSVAYAGAHASDVAGVINFVGGWVGTGCATAEAINGALFERGSEYHRPTLWLYGNSDPYYPIAHSRANFARFQKAGGAGAFQVFDVPGGYGHGLLYAATLWAEPVGAYLGSLSP